MPATSADEGSGLFAALRRIAITLLATGRTRLELLGTELEEEKIRLVRLVLMAQAMVFCLGVGALLLVGFITALLWESRLAVLGGLSAAFIVLGLLFYAGFKRATQRPEAVFSASIAALQADIRELKTAARHAQPPQ